MNAEWPSPDRHKNATGDTMTDPTASFAKMVPGFEFLQGLVKNAGAAIPGIGSWVAPTIDPAELEKRIEELRTVQFWLEQNARMLGATIQALEVQRMTLSTLKTMNVQMEDLRDSLQIKMPGAAASRPAAQAASADTAEPAGEDEKAPKQPATDAPGAADPMQWWGALTKQFTELATNAMRDGAAAAAKAAPGSVQMPFEMPFGLSAVAKASSAKEAVTKSTATKKGAATRSSARPASAKKKSSSVARRKTVATTHR
jgi:hypothetical protein